MTARPEYMHSLMRTSPFGQMFVGYCTRCGKQNLTTEDQQSEECPELLIEGIKEVVSNLVKRLRQEAGRNARMQSDKEHQTNRRRKTFRGRNLLFTQAADRIEELQAQVTDLTHYSEAVAEVVDEDTFEKIRAEYNLRAAIKGGDS